MTDTASQASAQRNKENYLKAKAAFNEKDMAGCMSYYARDHQIRSRDVGPGREHIEQFLSAMHANWSDLKIVVDHAVAEGDWVARDAQRRALRGRLSPTRLRSSDGDNCNTPINLTVKCYPSSRRQTER
jgi:ketosteroid isomerase-like protein